MPPIYASDTCKNASNLCVRGNIIMPPTLGSEALFA